LRQDNLVNMSARSVLSCIPFAPPERQALTRDPRLSDFGAALAAEFGAGQAPLHAESELRAWLDDLRASYSMQLTPRPLDRLASWVFEEDRISHATNCHFSVIAVAVEASEREVARWDQPLLQHSGHGINGFLMQRINGAMHLLVRACAFPGNGRLFELGSTVSRANAKVHFGSANAPLFLEYFQDPPHSWIRYRAEQSEEGGRFMHFVNAYMLVELPADHALDVPENYRWMTLAQLSAFNAEGHVNIEGRNLLSCFSLID
jgi:oxidase EvaA